MPSLKFENFSFTVPGKGQFLVQGTIQSGERICLMGPSGCGKTTLLKNCAGLLKNDSGALFLDEKDISSTPPQGRAASFVFATPTLFNHLSVIENLVFPLKFQLEFKNWSDELRTKRAQEFLAQAQLSSLADRPVLNLSSGEKQRLSLIRSLIYNPKFLLMDEPLSSIDPELKNTLQDWILAWISDRNIPVLIVTHNEQEAQKLGSRIIKWPSNSNTIQF